MADSKPSTARPSSTSRSSSRKPARLGRGLSTLMAQAVQVVPPPSVPSSAATRQQSHQPTADRDEEGQTSRAARTAFTGHGSDDGLIYISVDTIATNPHQPRQIFNEQALSRLAESIRKDGLMQPIIVRPTAGDDTNGDTTTEGAASGMAAPRDQDTAHHENHCAYELVAGERRLRAAQLAGLGVLPAIVRELDNRQMAEWALIENLQREDLNPIERAEAFQRLIDQFHLSHDQVAQRVGVERPTVSNCLRLLDLCDNMRRLVLDGLLSAGQAKALAGITDPQAQQMLGKRAVAQGWSVRQVEHEVRRALGGSHGLTDVTPQTKRAASPSYVRDLEQQMGQQLQTKVKIRPGRKKGSGTLSIEFYSLDQFDSLLQRFDVQVQMD